MTTAETARRLFVDAAGEPLCDSCLAFACSVSLADMRRVTEELLASGSFQRRDRCVACRRTVPALAFVAKCVQCSRPVLPGEDALNTGGGDIFHAACLRWLSADEAIRTSRRLSHESRRIIEKAQGARRRLHDEQRKPPGPATG